MAGRVENEPDGGLAVVLELLLSSPGRWTTLRATVVERTPKRQVERRIWLAEGGRVRCEETRSNGDEPVTTVALDGRQWWKLDPDEGVTIGHGDPPPVPWAPSECIDRFLASLGWFDLEVTGETEKGGRPCVSLQAKLRPKPGWSVPPHGLPGDHYNVVIDRDRGVVLGLEVRQDGEVVAVADVAEVVFDEDFGDEVFPGPPAGNDQRTRNSRERLNDKFVSLADAAASAPFTVFVPQRLPGEGCLQPVFLGRRQNDPAVTAIVSYDLQLLRFLTLHQAASGPDGVVLADTTCWERLERAGDTLYLCPRTGRRLGFSGHRWYRVRIPPFLRWAVDDPTDRAVPRHRRKGGCRDERGPSARDSGLDDSFRRCR